MLKEGSRKKGKQFPPSHPQKRSGPRSVHNELVSFPSLRVTLFAFLQIVSTFCINNPSASEGEGAEGHGEKRGEEIRRLC